VPKNIYVDKLGIDIKRNKIDIMQMISRGNPEKIDIDGAFLRHLGIIKDYEQFGSRLWSVRAIEQNGVYVMNEVESWLFASDKLATLTTLAKHGLPVPETFLSEDMFIAYNAVKDMKEVVVKQLRGAMGFGVFRLDDADVAMHIFSYFANASKPMYMQKYMEKKGGGDYRVIVVGGQVIGTEFRKGIDWKSNIAQGATPIAVKADSQLQEIAIKATGALGLEYAGIDVAETKDGYFVIETNPTISWQGFKQATKINVADVLIKHLISKIKE
jgi:RimK family alpha-L-glutamate ligase